MLVSSFKHILKLFPLLISFRSISVPATTICPPGHYKNLLATGDLFFWLVSKIFSVSSNTDILTHGRPSIRTLHAASCCMKSECKLLPVASKTLCGLTCPLAFSCFSLLFPKLTSLQPHWPAHLPSDATPSLHFFTLVCSPQHVRLQLACDFLFIQALNTSLAAQLKVIQLPG